MRKLVLAFAVLASPLQALSCLEPDPIQAYLNADSSADRYGAVVGRLDFDEARLPPAVGDGDQQDVEVRAHLVGDSLGFDGFTAPFQGNITLRIACFASWCGRPKSGAKYLIFIKREAGRHVAVADPCGGWMFERPSRDVLDKLHQCFVGGACIPDRSD